LAVDFEKITSLAKRRGFVFQGSEIYGGLNGTWDFGPLGVELHNNVKRAWWRSMVQLRDDVVGIDSAILMASDVWKASGHVDTFTDPLVDCKECKMRFRADQIEGENCPNCGGELTEPRQFNLMFKTYLGPVEDDAAVVYLRPETAQGMFVNFQNVRTVTRKRLPFGIAQIGKGFRNEISPGNFFFRAREFELMECEYFVRPDQSDAAYRTWIKERYDWHIALGLKPESVRFREHEQSQLSHYSAGTTDLEFLFPWGWGELEGIANRTDYDLRRHSEFSGKDLSYVDDVTNERFFPHVIEPAVGAGRATLAFLCDAYDEAEIKGEQRTFLRLHKALAPYKAAVLPLSKKEQLITVARDIERSLRPHWMIVYDETQSIGRRYARQDEIGTPYCVTVDFDTLDDRAVTIRERDSMMQERVAIAELVPALRDKLDPA
jgi:glycyl-tRNA synthetase